MDHSPWCLRGEWECFVGGDLLEEGRRGGEEPRNQFGWSVQEEMMGKLEEWAGAE